MPTRERSITGRPSRRVIEPLEAAEFLELLELRCEKWRFAEEEESSPQKGHEARKRGRTWGCAEFRWGSAGLEQEIRRATSTNRRRGLALTWYLG